MGKSRAGISQGKRGNGMNRSKPWILSKRNVQIVYGILVALMIIGTFLDLQINQVLYHPKSLFATFFACYGLYPAVIVTMAALAIFSRLIRERKTDPITLICTVLSALLELAAIKAFAEELLELSTLACVLNLIVSMGLAAAVFVYIYKNVNISDDLEARRVAMIILFSAGIQIALIKVIKKPWGRPRYRSIIKTDGMNYRPWYKFGFTDSARRLLASGMASDEFKSFPSGHAGCAGCLITLAYLPRVIPALKGRETLFTVLGIAWSFCTILARMISGAHFLTDVVAATILAWTSFVLVARALDKRGRHIG